MGPHPHFYYNYYVYQYATGYSAAIALSRRILKEGESAVKDYVQFLSGGCSKDPVICSRAPGWTCPAPSLSRTPWTCSAPCWTRWKNSWHDDLGGRLTAGLYLF